MAKPRFDSSKPFEAAPSTSGKPKFDPSKPLDRAPAANAPGVAETALRLGAQGLTAGFADEIAGGVGAAWNALTSEEKLLDAYKRIRDEQRAADAAAAAANPGTAATAEFVGGLASFLIPGGAAVKGAGALAKMGGAAKAGAGMGALSGLGHSSAEDVSGMVGDTVKGGLVGGALGGVGGAAAAGASRAPGPMRAAAKLAREMPTNDGIATDILVGIATGNPFHGVGSKLARSYGPKIGAHALDIGASGIEKMTASPRMPGIQKALGGSVVNSAADIATKNYEKAFPSARPEDEIER